MIDEKDKQEAWMALCQSIALGQVRWPNHLTREQIDYVKTCVDRKAIPGTKGRKLRSINRWNRLDFAFAVLKARNPDKSDREILETVAKHYGCSWTTVRKARSEMRGQDFSFAGRHRQLGLSDKDFAELALPDINFDELADD